MINSFKVVLSLGLAVLFAYSHQDNIVYRPLPTTTLTSNRANISDMIPSEIPPAAASGYGNRPLDGTINTSGSPPTKKEVIYIPISRPSGRPKHEIVFIPNPVASVQRQASSSSPQIPEPSTPAAEEPSANCGTSEKASPTTIIYMPAPYQPPRPAPTVIYKPVPSPPVYIPIVTMPAPASPATSALREQTHKDNSKDFNDEIIEENYEIVKVGEETSAGREKKRVRTTS